MRVLFAAALFSLVLLSTRDEVKDTTPQRVVFMGSSSIARWTSLERDFPGVRVVNRGISGTELSDSIQDADAVILYKPRTIVLYAGDNDTFRGKSPETVYADFKTFVAKIHATLPQTRIVFISIKPSPSRWYLKENIIAANALIQVECARDKRLRFADIFSVMLTATGELRQELFDPDTLHLNEAGYAIWKQVVNAVLK